MALSREVIDLRGLDLLNQPDEIGWVRHITEVHEEADSRLVGVVVEVLHTFGIEGRRTALDAVHDVALLQKEFGQIRTVLAGNPSN
jgi:hypothetical protein